MCMECGDCMQTTEAAIAFEGYEKRIEIEFFAREGECNYKGLRALTRPQLDGFLKSAGCRIVSQLSNEYLDSYILSESSLFVYPHKIVLKTCGTTKLLLSIPGILSNATTLCLCVKSVRYSRGTFIFAGAQSFPHRSFAEEVCYLETYFGTLGSGGGKAYVMGDRANTCCNWHVYSASVSSSPSVTLFTLEMCMTHLDPEKASVFYKSSFNSAQEMSCYSGIRDILPASKMCEFEFDPCGYSMNAIEGAAVSTIHVTPQEGFSYASFESIGYGPKDIDLQLLVERVVTCFKPKLFSISLHVNDCDCVGKYCWWTQMHNHPQGYVCDMISRQELPGNGTVLSLTYTMATVDNTFPNLIGNWEEETHKNHNWLLNQDKQIWHMI